MRIRWINATLWGAAVVLAVGAGTAAVAAASSDSGRRVLSRQDIDRELAGLPSVSPSAVAATPRADDNGQVSWVTGGTVVVTCSGDTATLLRWSPKTGYRADDPQIGPAAVVSVRFESDTASDVTVSVRCVGGKAVASTSEVGDDHGHDGTATPSPTAGGPDGGDDNGGDNHDGGGNRGSGGGSDDPSGHH
jgi:hypothetical protein